jgi:hypothetical protein
VPQVIGRGFLVPDPFVTLAVAATATEGVELGTATVQVPLHHPADLAHRVLSLLSVCGDRLTLGVSPGSTDIDHATVDRDHAARFRTLASAYRRTPDQIIAAHGRYRAAGGRRAIVCAIPLSGRDDLGRTGEVLQRYAEAGFDDAVVLIAPGGPDLGRVRALVP